MGLKIANAEAFELPMSIKPDCMASVEKEGIIEEVRGRLRELEKIQEYWERQADQRQVDAHIGAIGVLKWVLTDLLEASVV